MPSSVLTVPMRFAMLAVPVLAVPESSYLAGTGATWACSPRMDVFVGVFGSHESAKDDSGTVKARGGRLGLDFNWSKQFSGHLELTVERD
jgi:hypothetical protein